jgi:hypothetical protein
VNSSNICHGEDEHPAWNPVWRKWRYTRTAATLAFTSFLVWVSLRLEAFRALHRVAMNFLLKRKSGLFIFL